MSKTGNEIRMEDAKKAIQRVWGDQTVDAEETIANLETLAEMIETTIDAIISRDDY